MERALCMAHWLKHCKVNEPIYILSAAIWVKWRGRCFAFLCAVALFSTEECVRSTEVRWAYFTLSLWSKTITNGPEIEAAERSCRNVSTPLPPWHLFNLICKWGNNELLSRMLVSNVTTALRQQPIVRHEKSEAWEWAIPWPLPIKKKKKKRKCQGEESHLGLRRWETWQGRSTRITRVEMLWTGGQKED